MKSKDLILLAKLGKNNPQLQTVSQEDDGNGFQGVKTSSDSVYVPSAKMGGSLELLKAHKAGGVGHMPSAQMYEGGSMPKARLFEGGEIPRAESAKGLGGVNTESRPYSPVKNYLKKRK